MELIGLTHEQERTLSVWRALALERMPYMASILFAFRPVNAVGLGTFAVDEKLRLYIDFDAATGWDDPQNSEVLLHECGHVFRDHSARATDHGVQDCERQDWNIAGDACINLDLHQAGCRTPGESGILPSKIGLPDGETTEWYFDEIRKKRAAKQQRQSHSGQTRSGQPSSEQQGEPSSPSSGQGPGQSGQQGPQDPGQYKGCGSVSGAEPAPGEIGDGEGPKFAVGATDAERKLVQISTASNIKSHAASGRGTVPAGLVSIADQVLAPPKIPWRQVLSSSMRRSLAVKAGDFDVDYSRRHRRRHRVEIAPGRRVLYPGTFSPQPTVALVRDTSGSVGDGDLELITSEVDGIARQVGVRGKDLRVLDTDAAVHGVKAYRRATDLAEIGGRGGTDMRVGIEQALELRPRPTVIVVATDGETPWPVLKPLVPVVICLFGPRAYMAKVLCPDWAAVVVVEPD